ncbi:MAG: amidohydrolase [Chloroflexi bacterium]|nr:amidohydrolase [Chloroflexota bacterium]
MIIDAHAHGYHGGYLEQLEDAGGNWAKERVATLRERALLKPAYIHVGERMRQLARNNIDLQVVMPSHSMDSNLFPGDTSGQLALARAINDNMARLMEDSKGRLLPGGSVPLGSYEKGGRQEMERAIKTLGLKAVTLPSNIRGRPLDLPVFEPFWARAAELGVPVYIHPAGPAGQKDRSYEAQYDLIHNFGWPFETTLALSRLVFSGVMERYPSLRIVSHHLGGMIPFFWGRTNETYNPDDQQRIIGCVLARPLFDYFSRFYYDTAVGGSAPAIRCAYEVFGASHLIFATDAPNGPGTGDSRLATYPGVIRSLGLSRDENEMIFERNARRVLNL